MLEGAKRSDHFRGVTTVLTKIFNILKPNKVYFGQKDFQQCLVIKKLAADLNTNVKIIICPTVREPDGLAMSSRNVYLSPEERAQAPVLYHSLELARKIWSEGERNSNKIRQAMGELISHKSLGKIEYISIANALTLQELEQAQPPMVISTAVILGKTRLIDNILLEKAQK
jgi:pantoate--beta-alanine ligase